MISLTSAKSTSSAEKFSDQITLLVGMMLMRLSNNITETKLRSELIAATYFISLVAM